MHKILPLSVMSSLLSLLLACGASKQFSGAQDANAKRGAAQAAAADGSSACQDQSGTRTQTRLLSEGISKRSDDQTLRYELSLVSCADGQPVSLQDKALYFDLDVVSTSRPPPIAFQVLSAAPSETLEEGIFQHIRGSDLFGRQGNYHHWQTESLNYVSLPASLILEIRLKGLFLKPMYEMDVTADSYLRIGDAAPITQSLLWLD